MSLFSAAIKKKENVKGYDILQEICVNVKQIAKLHLKNLNLKKSFCGGIGRHDRFKIYYPLDVPVQVWSEAPI